MTRTDVWSLQGSERIRILVERGFCIDEWDRWHMGQCGTYALVLMKLRPDLRLGLCGTMDGEFFSWEHAFAHDDRWAYDAAGRHPLPYHGAWGESVVVELDQDPDDYNFLHEDAGPEGPEPNIAAAKAHIERNGILDCWYQPVSFERWVGIIGRDSLLIDRLAQAVHRRTHQQYPCTDLREIRRGQYFEVQITDSDGKPTGHIARVEITLDRIEQET